MNRIFLIVAVCLSALGGIAIGATSPRESTMPKIAFADDGPKVYQAESIRVNPADYRRDHHGNVSGCECQLCDCEACDCERGHSGEVRQRQPIRNAARFVSRPIKRVLGFLFRGRCR